MTESVTQAIRKAARAAGPAAGKESSVTIPTPVAGISMEERHRMIAEAAYYRAAQRNFSDADSPEHDWLLAEQQIDRLLAKRQVGARPPATH